MEQTQQLGPYRIEAELAQSSTTTVYRAYDPSLNRPVLIKKLHSQMAREDDIRGRFEREARVCAQVKHENIVGIYSYYTEPELTMLALEFVEGFSLRDLISKRGPIDWRTTLAILSQVLNGLAFAHDKGVLHRDIKPDNILVSHAGEVKISDFGLATLENAPQLTHQGAVVGTPAYMAPEQISGAGLDQRSDLFSLGTTLYEALTGISPFKADSFPETLKLILNAQVQKPSSIVPDIPAELDQMVLRCLEKRPRSRYATAEQMAEDAKLLASQKSVPIGVEPVRDWLAQGEETRGVRVESEPAPTSAIQRSRRGRWIAGVAAVGAVVVATALWWALRTPKPPAVTPEMTTEQDTATVAAIDTVPAALPETLLQTRSAPVETSPPLRSEPRAHTATQPGRSDTIPETTGFAAAPPETTTAPPPEQPVAVYINSRPWARITIDNKVIRQTPLTAPVMLTPGEHQVTLFNDQFPTPITERFNVKPNGEQRFEFNLWERFGVIRILSVQPWAEIIINGESYGETPMAKPIILPFGSYRIELRNPAMKPWSETYILEPGGRQVEISVKLEPRDS